MRAEVSTLPLAKVQLFSGWPPGLLLGYFLGIIGITIVCPYPATLAISLGFGCGCFICIKGSSAFSYLLGLAVLGIFVALLNPLFMTEGTTVLFEWGNQRPYTLEGLAWGASTAAMVCAVMVWFASFHQAFTSEACMQLFGSLTPALALLLTQVLRLIPTYRRRAAALLQARAGIGKGVGSQETLRRRIEGSSQVLGALCNEALENSIITADAMNGRGFSLQPKSHFKQIRWTLGYGVLAALVVLLFIGAACGLFLGLPGIQYVPTITLGPPSGLGYLGLLCFGLHSALPLLLVGKERVQWMYFLSKS